MEAGMRGTFVTLLAVGTLLSVPASAHHGSAAFENGKSLELKGTVTQWVYSNPHLLLTFEVKGAEGTVVKWVAETQAPNIMYPAGYRRDSFKPGDEVTVTLTPAKNNRPIGRIIKVVTATGWTLGGIQDPPIPPPGK
jgi:hypothetical protein